MSSRSTFLCFLSLVFLASLASSQVLIREKVEVKPNPALRSIQGTAASEIRVESSFDGPIDATHGHFVYVRGPCGAELGGDISGTLTAPAYDGVYTIGYTVTSPSGGGFRFAVYLGDSLLWLTQGPVNCPSGCTLKGERNIRLYAGFTFWPQYALIGSGGTNYFGAAESTATAPCSTGPWYGEWPIELEITKGQDVGIFVNGAVRSYKVVKKVSDFYTLTFVGDGEKGYGDVEITARSGGLTVVKGFKVVAPAPTVRIVPPWWWRGDPITLAFDNLPILDFTETHTPKPGQKFEPVITWDPNDTINTADYYNLANELYVKVRAENAGGVARDSVKLEFQTECIKVNFDPPELSTGDTARLSFQRVNEDGTLQDLPHGSYAFSVMIVGGEDSSKGLFVTEEQDPFEEPKIGTTLLNETSPILYVAPASIADAELKVQVIASAWELMWWKEGEIKDPKKAVLEIQNIQAQGKESAKEARLIPAGVPQRPEGRALEAVMKAMSSWCPISQVVVKGLALDHFTIKLQKDTIAFTEATRLFVQAKDANDQDVELDLATPLKLSVVTNVDYGTFIDKKGDTLKTVPVTLADIPYGDAKDGFIRIAAVKKNPDSLEVCRLRAELQSDATKKGEKDVPVLEQTLKILMTPPYEAQPVIRPATVDQPGTENRKAFTVRLTRGGKPVGNHPFHLTTDYIDGSGGHNHIDPRRTETRENYGHFILRRTQGHVNRPYDGETQGNGREEFDYVASIFGDRMKIGVDSRRNPLLWDTLSIAELVPDLNELGNGAHYELVGAPQNHAGTNDACRQTPPRSQHRLNHFGKQVLLTAIQSIAALYDSLRPGTRLRINDMSLQYGGLFDANNNWNIPHREHRKGINADIGISGLDDQNRCVPINERDVRSVIVEKTGIAPLKEVDPPHYHIYVREN
jgi:hypothetical protein